MTSARDDVTREIHDEMESYICCLNALRGRRGFIAERNLDDDYVSPLENALPFTNS